MYDSGLTSSRSGLSISDLGAIRVWEAVQRRWLILILGMVVGVCLALTYWFFWPRTYESSAKILVMRKDPTIAASGVSRAPEVEGPHVSSEVLATHVELLRSRKIVAEALERNGLDRLPSIIERLDLRQTPADYVIEHLNVTSGGEGAAQDAHVLNVPFRHKSDVDAQRVVQAIVGRYQEFLDETFVDINTEAAELIAQAQIDLTKELKAVEEEYRTFRESAPLLWSSSQGVMNTHRVQYEQIRKELADLELQISESQSRLDLAETTLKKMDQDGASGLERLALIDAKNTERVNLLVRVQQGDSQSAQFQALQPERTAGAQAEHDDLLELLAKEKTMLEEFGPTHPDVVDTRNRIAVIRQFLQDKSELLKVDEEEVLDPKKLVDAYANLLRNDLESARQRQAHLTTLAAREEEAAKSVVKFELEEQELRSKLDRTQQLYNVVVDRLRDINLAKDYNGFVHEVIAAPKVGLPVWPNLLVCLILGTFVGLVFGASGAAWAEMRDSTFHDPMEIQDTLELPVRAHVPTLGVDTNHKPGPTIDNRIRVSPLVCALHRPYSVDAEVFRGFRTALFFRAQEQSLKVIAITSPGQGDGKTIVASNLAVSIAQSGRRVLLIDCNLRRPRLHEVFGLENDTGLTSLLAGKADPPDVVTTTAAANLWVLPCGPVRPDSSELLTSRAFRQILDWSRDHYDFVLLDSPPVLAVSDPCIMAPLADAVALIVRVTTNARKQALRAKEMLLGVGVNIAGVLVNEWDSPRRGYGYRSRYQYRDGSSYGAGTFDTYCNSNPQHQSDAQRS
jgi:capsular exopolysaccharide synthesis family protein